MINEFIKRNFNRGENRQPYFWQDNHGKEIDCLLVDGERVTPVEVKSGKTISTSYFDNLKYWRSLTALPEDQGYVVYGGDQSMQTSAGALISWRNLDRIPRKNNCQHAESRAGSLDGNVQRVNLALLSGKANKIS